MTIQVQTSPDVVFGNPELVFEQAYFRSFLCCSYDVSPDGERFLMITEEGVFRRR